MKCVIIIGIFIIISCVSGRVITERNRFLDCNAFESGSSIEACANVNEILTEILEITSSSVQRYFFSDNDDDHSIKDPNMIETQLIELGKRWLQICLDARITGDCGKNKILCIGVPGEDKLLQGINATVWRGWISYPFGLMITRSRDDLSALRNELEESRNLSLAPRKQGILSEIESQLLREDDFLKFAAEKTQLSAEIGFMLNEGPKIRQEYWSQGLVDFYPGYLSTLAKLEGVRAKERFTLGVTRLRDLLGVPNNKRQDQLGNALIKVNSGSQDQRRASLIKNYPDIAKVLF